MSKTEIEIFIAMNEGGDYDVAGADEDARDRLVDVYGGYAVRIVKLKVAMSAPSYEEPAASVDILDGDTAVTAEAR